jgi:ferric-dicitrate binding protein FerR (iron transport regulator)
MTEPSPRNEQEQADLVAYLDGELTGEAARTLEAKLSLDPQARAEADALRRTWELLDYLPRPEPSARFTHRTLERLSPVRSDERRRRRRWRSGCLALGWVAALVLAGWAGYAGYNWFVPREPGDKELIHDLRLIENKRYYDLVEDLEFWRALDTPELFGDEQASL